MPSYEAESADFERYDAQVVGISVDSVPSHVAFAKSLGGIEKYPLLADFHPKGEVARKYGVWIESAGKCERAIVIVDSVRLGFGWQEVHGPRPGYFPFYIGLIICVSSLVTLLQAVFGKAADSNGTFVERSLESVIPKK